MSTQSWHVWNWAHVCVNPTWTIEEIFDLEAQQRGRDAGFIVHLSCYCMQPQHIIIQWLWQSLSCVWKKVETIKQLHNWNISVRVCVCVCGGGGGGTSYPDTCSQMLLLSKLHQTQRIPSSACDGDSWAEQTAGPAGGAARAREPGPQPLVSLAASL